MKNTKITHPNESRILELVSGYYKKRMDLRVDPDTIFTKTRTFTDYVSKRITDHGVALFANFTNDFQTEFLEWTPGSLSYSSTTADDVHQHIVDALGDEFSVVTQYVVTDGQLEVIVLDKTFFVGNQPYCFPTKLNKFDVK